MTSKGLSTKLMSALPALFLTLFILSFRTLPALGVEQQVVSEGGPYVADGSKLQQFVAEFNITPSLQSRPLTLAFYNGFGGRPGFEWVRVFLLPEGYITQAGSAAQPAGEILADESTFRLRNHETLDMSG